MALRLSAQSFWRRWRPVIVDLFNQWPWIYPRGIEPSARQWVERARAKVGWYRSLRSDWLTEIYLGNVEIHSPPEDLPAAARRAFSAVGSRSYPDASVSFLHGANLFSNEGLVLTRDNHVLSQYYHQFGTKLLWHRFLRHPFSLTRTQVTRVDDVLALLAAPQGWNYYHWLFDVLPRLHLLTRWRSVIEKYAVPENVNAVQLETLQLLGLATEQLHFLKAGQRLRCQSLYVPSLPGSESCYPPWSLEFLRSSFLPISASIAGQGPRIYIQRGASAQRPILNESELIAVLEKRGFTVVALERHSFREQVAIFRDARLVVAAHGAGLANLIFSGNQAALLELFSSDYMRPDCYFTLARRIGVAYDCWLDDVPAGTRQPWGAILADLPVITQKLDQLEKL